MTAGREPSPWDCDERGHVPTPDGCLNCGASPHYGLSCCGHRPIQHTDLPNGYGNTDRCRCCRKARAVTPPARKTT